MTLPQWAPENNALDLIKQAESWISKQLEKAIQPVPFASGVDIPVFGQQHRIKFQSFDSLNLEHDPDSKTIHIKGYTPQIVPTLLTDWLWQQIQEYTCEKINSFAQHIGKSVDTINIKDLNSRWGSCSSRNNISLSWRLVFAPYNVVDYVCAHEVAHLKEMNHSPRFWRIVEQLCPDHKDLRLWLRKNSTKLHSYGADSHV